MIIADTDILIDFLRGTGSGHKVRDSIAQGTLATTSISCFELYFGARSERQFTAIETLLNALTIFELDRAAALKGAEIARTLETQGQRIGMADSLIAGICLDRDMALLTNNTKHYTRISGLLLVNL